MPPTKKPPALRRVALSLAACGAIASTVLVASRVTAGEGKVLYDPVLLEPAIACTPGSGGMPAVFRNLVLAKTETQPFKPQPMKAAGGDVPLLEGLGKL